MAAVTAAQMREIETRAISAGFSEAELMEQAGQALGIALGCQFPEAGLAVAYVGRGHNAGDALIALRVLKEGFGWEIRVRAAFPVDEWAELTRRQWSALGLRETADSCPPARFCEPLLLIDGLLGIGAKGALREPLAGLAGEMNHLRETRGALTVAVDLPSGTDPDSGEISPGAVTADRTYMIGAPKRGLLLGHAANATGALALVEVPGLEGGEGDLELVSPQTMGFGKRPREFDFHKGKAGRIAILAGSPSYSGAAVIAALGAMRAGAGLVTLHPPAAAADAIRSRLPIEAMLKPCDDPRELLEGDHDALVIGPGLGEMEEGYRSGLRELLSSSRVPTVIDADGLALLGEGGVSPRENHLLTPHPGEFERLAPDLEGKSREDAARQFVSGSGAVLLLKGARTIVAKDGRPLRINSTGSPAMSNGGQGDLLSGVLGALLASGMDAFDAAAHGAWLCGHAAELHTSHHGPVCTAADTASHLGAALRAWRGKER
jgi:ADP-dependent NAD(P)H-hydrate dehydratase / NAD(P)H-hydrate epimerase